MYKSFLQLTVGGSVAVLETGLGLKDNSWGLIWVSTTFLLRPVSVTEKEDWISFQDQFDILSN